MTSPDLFRALAVVCEQASPDAARVAGSLGLPGAPDAAAHTDLFCLQLPPYASIHLGAEGMLGGEAGARVGGFWRALGLTPPPEPDHLAALLGLYAAVIEAEAEEEEPARRLLRTEARRALLWEHVLPWVLVYTRAVAKAAGPTYRAWAETLEAVLRAEAEITDPEGPGDRSLPAHLRAAPEPVVLGDGGLDEFLGQVLVPVRSGMVITRRDLAGAARDLGLGLRVGERRFILSALAGQDPVAICGWLAGEAQAWADQHARLVPALGPVAGFWQARAETTAARLLECRPTLKLVADAAHGGG